MAKKIIEAAAENEPVNAMEESVDSTYMDAAKKFSAGRESEEPFEEKKLEGSILDGAVVTEENVDNEQALDWLRRQSSLAGAENRESSLASAELLRSAMRSHRSLHGIVSSVESDDKTVYAIVFLRTVKVKIPCKDFFKVPPVVVDEDNRSETERTKERLNREKQVLCRSIGADVLFRITKVTVIDEKSYVFEATASRKAAILAQEDRYFGDPDSPHAAKVNNIVPARIIAVGPHNAFINVLGVDISVHKSALTSRYVPTLGDLYTPGQMIYVQIVDIKRNADGVLTSLAVSGRRVENAIQKRNVQRLTVGGRYEAVVTSLKAKAGEKIVYNLYLDGMNAPAIATKTFVLEGNLRYQPRVGSRVLFAVTHLADEFAIGAIIRLI